jgi:dynein heavy chain
LIEEGKRWVETVAILNDQINCSTADVFISSACISYCGPFTGIYRSEITHEWLKLIKEREVPISDHFSVVK